MLAPSECVLIRLVYSLVHTSLLFGDVVGMWWVSAGHTPMFLRGNSETKPKDDEYFSRVEVGR